MDPPHLWLHPAVSPRLSIASKPLSTPIASCCRRDGTLDSPVDRFHIWSEEEG